MPRRRRARSERAAPARVRGAGRRLPASVSIPVGGSLVIRAVSPGSHRRLLHRDRRAAGAARQMLAATSNATVWLPSMTRARRNQVVNGSARTVRGGTSARSRTTRPNPPACSTRFIAFERACGIAGLANPQQARQIEPGGGGRFRIEAIAGVDERDELATATTAAASARQTTVGRPDDRPPTISERCPRRRPPPSAASIDGTPVAARSSPSGLACSRRGLARRTSSLTAIRVRRARQRDVELAGPSAAIRARRARSSGVFSLFLRLQSSLRVSLRQTGC